MTIQPSTQRELPRFGSFGFQTVVDTYAPVLSEVHPGDTHLGMTLQGQYFYGGLRDAEGVTYMVERKFSAAMTNGLWLMSDKSGETALLPEAMLATRGEAIRRITPERREWKNHLLRSVGAEVAESQEQPLSLVLDGDRLEWSEGRLLELTGTVQGPGFQIYAPDRSEPVFYTSQFYWVTGTVLGREVEGFIGLDHSYFAPGSEWKEYRVYNDLEIAWTVFCNKYADDSVEYGVIVTGKQGFGGAVVYDSGVEIANTNRVKSTFSLQESGDIALGTSDLETATYTFTATPTGSMPHFSKARWAGYRAQAGIARRVGDDREPVNAFSWTEFFPERMASEGLLVD